MTNRNTFGLTLCLPALLALALVSCRKETVPVTDRGTSYYPYAEGLWWEYDMDSTWYNDFSGDTVHLQYIRREEFDSFFVADNGSMAIRIERYYRSTEAEPWKGPRIWWTYTTTDYAVKVEENNAFVKLIFPLNEGTQWNGNRLNYMDARSYTCETKDVPADINGNNFDSTTTILQADYETLLEKQFYEESYARRVGLIHRRIIDVRGFTDEDNIPDTIVKPLMQRIKSGVVIEQKIRSWGVQ